LTDARPQIGHGRNGRGGAIEAIEHEEAQRPASESTSPSDESSSPRGNATRFAGLAAKSRDFAFPLGDALDLTSAEIIPRSGRCTRQQAYCRPIESARSVPLDLTSAVESYRAPLSEMRIGPVDITL
jgi:hypothetical protein